MRALVTGGTGFLGRRIVELLRARGDAVEVLARHASPEIEALGATLTLLDLRDRAAVRAAVAAADVVYHVAGKTGPWSARKEIWSVNLDGTRNVLEAVRRHGIRRVVYTSTPSVIGYARDVENGRQDLPYATSHESAYPASKAAAEQLVLAANTGGVATIALRPHLIIGPGDRNMLPAILRQAARRRLPMIGDGRNRVDLTFVDNAAWAHLDAADALTGPDAPCAGKAYFITNGEPVPLWEWLRGILRELGLPPVTRSLSLRSARLVATAGELLWRGLALGGEPPITRFLAGALARSHWYDLAPARHDIGYRVRVPMEEATRRTLRWLAALQSGRPPEPPPVHPRPERSYAS